VRWPLSLPFLLLLAWGMAGLLWWDSRRRVIFGALVPWTMAGMAMVALAMVLLLASLPASFGEQLVRAVLLIEGVYGFWALSDRNAKRSGDGRR
jgi:hypothetical protein